MWPERSRILVYGATGAVGRRVAAEALRRGHDVTGVVRRPQPVVPAGVSVVQGDAGNAEAVRRLAAGYDVVVSATRPKGGHEAELVQTAKSLVAGLSGTSCRLIVVGGAASLVVPSSGGVLVLDDPDYVRDPWRAIAQACVDQLGVLRRAESLTWTSVSPPAFLEESDRRGTYRVETDQLIVDECGRSHISYADFAVAIVDEIETRRFLGRRFTVGY